MAKFRIFLSHVTVESRLADLLREHLVHDFIGLVDVFESSDRLSIPAGTKWLSEVTEGLRDAGLHLILCSHEATTRPWIQFEAGAAHVRGVPIVPVCHSGLTTAQLPVPLSVYEGIQASDPEGLKSLYSTIASALGSEVPGIDFEKFAAEVAAFEKEYLNHRATISSRSDLAAGAEEILAPKALCISSKQFADLGFKNQLQTVLDAFPSKVPHQRVFSSDALTKTITKAGPFDIVHIAAYVCPRSGDLYFSDVNLKTGEGIGRHRDVLRAEGLAQLLQAAQTKLAVIGSCDSIVLGAILVSVCHVIAARDMVSAKMMAAWVEAFYSKLPQTSLSEALDFAQNISHAPMRFYARQTRSVDLVFVAGTPDRRRKTRSQSEPAKAPAARARAAARR